MPTIWGTRRGVMIVPYQKFMETLEEFPEGVRLRIKVDADRNGKFSALYHLMLGKVVKAINAGPAKTDIKTIKEFIKLKRGWFEVVELRHHCRTAQNTRSTITAPRLPRCPSASSTSSAPIAAT